MSAACDRRVFLGAAGGTVAAAALTLGSVPALGALAGRSQAGEGPGPRGIRRSLKLGMVGVGSTLREKFALLRELGYDGVEIDSPSELDLEEVLRAMEETGLRVPGVVDAWHWQYTLGDPDPEVRRKGREGLERALRDAQRVGASTVLLVPAVVDARIRYHEAYDRSREELAALLPLADELGVAIACENVWNHFLLSPREAAQYVDSFDSPRVGWYLDLGNLVRNAWPEHWVAALGRRIYKLDIKDYSRRKRDQEGLWKGFEVEIGDGDVGWPEVMAALDQVPWGLGGERWASAEVAGGDAERLRAVLERMDQVLGS
jgi:L-ribulose-5-phosphate 3-epimerase